MGVTSLLLFLLFSLVPITALHSKLSSLRPFHELSSPPSIPLSPPPSPSPPSGSPPLPPIPFAPLARLTNISVSYGGKLVPDFNQLVFNYIAIMGANVKKFAVTVYFPEQEVGTHYAANIESMPLKSGVESPLLNLGKRGKNVTFHIFVTAINHRPCSYLLVARREPNGWKEIAEKIFMFLGFAVLSLVGVVVLYFAYKYICKKRTRILGAFQTFRHPRDHIYEPLATIDASLRG